jgi:hypothetical protein
MGKDGYAVEVISLSEAYLSVNQQVRPDQYQLDV